MESNLLSRLEDLQPLVRAIARQWSRDRPAEEDDLAQEIATRLWLVLRRRPDAPHEYLAAAARHAALDYRTRGPSVDRLSQSGRQHPWQMVSLEALLDEDDEETGHLPGPHRGDGASPVEDMVVARLLYDQLRERLTPRQAAFLILRLRGATPLGRRETSWASPQGRPTTWVLDSGQRRVLSGELRGQCLERPMPSSLRRPRSWARPP